MGKRAKNIVPWLLYITSACGVISLYDVSSMSLHVSVCYRCACIKEYTPLPIFLQIVTGPWHKWLLFIPAIQGVSTIHVVFFIVLSIVNEAYIAYWLCVLFRFIVQLE